MKLLEERIKKDGQVPEGDVLKINSLLNHQVDPKLMMEVGQEFARLFKDSDITKISACETPGTTPNIMIAYILNVLMVFVRKKKLSIPNDAVYLADVFSYTKKVNNKICVEKKFLSPTDKVLVPDDFAAYDEAVKGMASIVQQAGARIVGVGAVVAKDFQGGSDWIKKQGLCFEALANIASSEGGEVRFVGEE